MCVEIYERLNYLSGEYRIVGYPRVAVHLEAIAPEDPLESREAIASRLGHLLVQRRRVVLGPCFDAQAFEIAAQCYEATSMAWLGQNAFIRGKSFGADTEPDQASIVWSWEPG